MKKLKNLTRQSRHQRVRRNVAGTSVRPRLSVFRSNKFIYAQIIDDTTGQTLLSISDLKQETKGSKIDRAHAIGVELAKASLKKGIKKVVFDRGGYLYHGRVEKLAKGARDGGLEF